MLSTHMVEATDPPGPSARHVTVVNATSTVYLSSRLMMYTAIGSWLDFTEYGNLQITEH